jgi:hypothetical protein
MWTIFGRTCRCSGVSLLLTWTPYTTGLVSPPLCRVTARIRILALFTPTRQLGLSTVYYDFQRSEFCQTIGMARTTTRLITGTLTLASLHHESLQ